MRTIRDEDLRISTVTEKSDNVQQKTVPEKGKSRNKGVQTSDKTQARIHSKPQTVSKMSATTHSTSGTRGICPAVESICAYCKKTGHWRAVCQRAKKSLLNY